MSKKASPTLIGAFVVGAVALAFAAILVFGGGKFFSQTRRFVLFFDGSIKGLNVGSPVVFRGVKLGTVADVLLRLDTRDLSVSIPVIIELDPERFFLSSGVLPKGKGIQDWIDKGLRAQLEMQSLVTGQLMVGLDFHPDKPARLQGIDMDVPEIPTIPTPLQAFLEKVQEIPLHEIVGRATETLREIQEALASANIGESLKAAEETLRGLRDLVQEVRAGVKPILAGADRSVAKVEGLMENADGAVTEVRTLVRETSGRLGPTMDRVDRTLEGARDLARRLDAQVDPVAASVRGAADDAGALMRSATETLDPVASSLRRAADEAAAALEVAKDVLGAVSGRVAHESPLAYELTQTLREVSAAARSLRALGEYLQQRPDALIRGKAAEGGR